MDIQRIWTLLGKEVRYGLTNFMAIYVLVIPVVLSLLVSLVFGDLFAQTPRLGVHDADAANGGNSSFVQPLLDHESINTRMFNSRAALEAAVERGQVEMGISVPVGFAEALASDSAEVNDVHTYVWGEGTLSNLLKLDAVMARAFMDGTQLDFAVQLESQQLGSANTQTWAQRLLPLILIMSIVLGGLFIPASSLIEEKTKGTLVALTTTPTSLLDVYLSKTILGFILSAIMATIILAMNQALTGQISLLMLVIGLGAMMSATFGIIMGSVSKDMDTFMGLVKAMGLLLYAPGILQMFPNLPEWIGRIFPTYYVMNPLLEISQNGAGLGDIALELLILVVIVGVLMFGLTRVLERQQQQLALA